MSRVTRKQQSRQARSAPPSAAPISAPSGFPTLDSFQNFALSLGKGTDNAGSGDTYGYNPITLNRTLLEWMYRGSWLAQIGVDLIAEDMTRGGIELKCDWKPEDTELFNQCITDTQVWGAIGRTIKPGRLYGGAVGVMLIDGQDLSTPLNPDTVAPGQFKGIVPLDRWMVEVDPSQVVEDWGPDMGLPEYYTVHQGLKGVPEGDIHHTRVFRSVGVELPYWQAQMNNLWGMSIFEPIFDRLTSFDSATTGASQLVSKLWTRVYQIEGLRQIIAAGGKPRDALMAQVDMMRRLQSNEGITLIDAKDNFIPHAQTVNTGVTDTLVQLGQQISGCWQIPLVRLFGQSPTGMNSTGESDLRTYYDNILRLCERDLRPFLSRLIPVIAGNIGKTLPANWRFTFNSLWQTPDGEQSTIAAADTDTTLKAFDSGIIRRGTALKELREQGSKTGRWSNITDEDIEDAMNEPPPASEEAMQQARQQGLEDQAAQQQLMVPPEGQEEPEDGGEKPKARDSLALSEIGGVPVVVECQKGARRWPGGPHWPAAYGYIRGTRSAEGEGEQLDCFIGPNLDSRKCWIFNHYDDHGQFEEHKVMLGYADLAQAKADYGHAYGRAVRGGIEGIPVHNLLKFLRNFNVAAPIVKSRNIHARDALPAAIRPLALFGGRM